MGRIYAERIVAFLFSAAVSMTVLCFKEQERIHREFSKNRAVSMFGKEHSGVCICYKRYRICWSLPVAIDKNIAF